MITIRLPSIRQRAKQVFSDPSLWTQRDVVFQLMASAAGLDAELALWFDSLPSVWRHRTVATLKGMPDDLETSEIWPGPVNIYEDLVVSNIVNNYRMGRIFSQAVIIACLARQATSREAVEANRKYQEAVRIGREMVNDICATVPFHLGYDIKDRSRKIGQQATAAEAIGGYFLLWPLFVCARLECVPAEQKRWIRGRLGFIARTYGIDGLRFLERQPENYVTRGIHLTDDPVPDVPPENSSPNGWMGNTDDDHETTDSRMENGWQTRDSDPYLSR
ncbi:MAG: hypothetical protein M1822_004785 [Bathelium mastoideum]|nr:MAG: hypothetical protein M1822_004785 [Bathelium mastoideum]